MDTSFARLFNRLTPTRTVDLGLPSGAAPSAGSTCEVVEFADGQGWDQWDDTVFVQDFEDSTL